MEYIACMVFLSWSHWTKIKIILIRRQLGGYETIQEAEQAIKQTVFGHNFNNFNPNPIRKNSIKIVVTIIPSYT